MLGKFETIPVFSCHYDFNQEKSFAFNFGFTTYKPGSILPSAVRWQFPRIVIFSHTFQEYRAYGYITVKFTGPLVRRLPIPPRSIPLAYVPLRRHPGPRPYTDLQARHTAGLRPSRNIFSLQFDFPASRKNAQGSDKATRKSSGPYHRLPGSRDSALP